MIEKIGKRIGPVSLVFAMSIIGMMAALIVLTSTTGDVQAQCPAGDPLCFEDIFATVEELTAPTNVMATVDDSDPAAASVTVTWTDGENAAQHIVLLLDSDFALAQPVHAGQTDGMTTFQGVPAGSYTVVVVAIESASHYMYSHGMVSVGQ